MYTLACPMMDFKYKMVYPPDGGGIGTSTLLLPSQLLKSLKPSPLFSLG